VKKKGRKTKGRERQLRVQWEGKGNVEKTQHGCTSKAAKGANAWWIAKETGRTKTSGRTVKKEKRIEFTC